MRTLALIAATISFALVFVGLKFLNFEALGLLLFALSFLLPDSA